MTRRGQGRDAEYLDSDLGRSSVPGRRGLENPPVDDKIRRPPQFYGSEEPA